MDYVVGGVAALISGNVTPSRPKPTKRALTPTKQPPSPNVTPRSEFVDDRSIFLSPTMQKKKAIVKKSPKRIFQNTDEDIQSNDNPKIVKVKKHLKDDLDSDSPNKSNVSETSTVLNASKSPKKKKKQDPDIMNSPSNNKVTPKKRKKDNASESEVTEGDSINNMTDVSNDNKTKKKKNKQKSTVEDMEVVSEKSIIETPNENSPKKKKRNKSKNKNYAVAVDNTDNKANVSESVNENNPKKKNNKRKNKTNKQNQTKQEDDTSELEDEDESSIKEKSKLFLNPNAITDKDSDSEHDSDDEMESENEEIKGILDAEQAESSDEEEEEEKPKQKEEKIEREEVNTEEELKRTLFVGNVPFSSKCKKELKKIFDKYGQIETVRIRTVPVKDARVTPKLAVIKNELHPERTTVNVYIKFRNAVAVDDALAENNTVFNGNHLRVTRSESTGAEHDPHCSVFVGNLPFALEDEALRDKFEKCGEIVSVRIIRDKKTNAGKGFGYVNFATKDAVELALVLPEEELTIKNRIIRVKRCVQNNQRPMQKFNSSRGFGGHRGGFRGNQDDSRGNQDGFRGNRGSFRGNRGRGGQRGGFRGRGGQRGGYHGNQSRNQDEGADDGAQRRIMNKRKQENSGDGPPNKKQNVTETHKEKKPKKEFLGMTAEKKKKNKFDKSQKKKKALSEILTK